MYTDHQFDRGQPHQGVCLTSAPSSSAAAAMVWRGRTPQRWVPVVGGVVVLVGKKSWENGDETTPIAF